MSFDNSMSHQYRSFRNLCRSRSASPVLGLPHIVNSSLRRSLCRNVDGLLDHQLLEEVSNYQWIIESSTIESSTELWPQESPFMEQSDEQAGASILVHEKGVHERE